MPFATSRGTSAHTHRRFRAVHTRWYLAQRRLEHGWPHRRHSSIAYLPPINYEPTVRLKPLSVANQAADFERISRASPQTCDDYVYHYFGPRGNLYIERGQRIPGGFRFTSESGTGADRVRTRLTAKTDRPWVIEKRLEYLRTPLPSPSVDAKTARPFRDCREQRSAPGLHLLLQIEPIYSHALLGTNWAGRISARPSLAVRLRLGERPLR